jgi:hypothetical protein
MNKRDKRTFPQWLFLILAVGAIWASGIYLGKMTMEGTSTAYLLRVIGFGALGLVMAWGAIAK